MEYCFWLLVWSLFVGGCVWLFFVLNVGGENLNVIRVWCVVIVWDF